MPRPTKYDWPAMEPRIAELNAMGLTAAQIGAAMGVPAETIKPHMTSMRREGRLPAFRSGDDYSVTGPQMAAMHADGASYNAIARHFGVARGAAIWQCAKHGVTKHRSKPDAAALAARRAMGPEPLPANCDYARRILGFAA